MNLIDVQSNDDKGFVEKTNIILNNFIKSWSPKETFLIKIDNWFDDKWLSFKGTKQHNLAFWDWTSENITFPPFHPNRVFFEKKWRRFDNNYQEEALKSPIHLIQESEENFKRKIIKNCKNTLICWFSDNTILNTRGSIMIYFIQNQEVIPFYIELKNNANWKVSKTKAISSKFINQIINS